MIATVRVPHMDVSLPPPQLRVERLELAHYRRIAHREQRGL